MLRCSAFFAASQHERGFALIRHTRVMKIRFCCVAQFALLVHPLRVLYRLHDLHRLWMDPVAAYSGATAQLLLDSKSSLASTLPARWVAANHALLHRLTRRYDKPAFALGEVEAHGERVLVREKVVVKEAFCQLVHFERASTSERVLGRLATDPKVLVCAPLSGHHATLVRDTLKSLLHDHDVYVTDWLDAREVPLSEDTFGLDDYVHTVQRYVRHLGAAALHVVAVCQPTVPVLAAVALLAQDGEATPRTLTLMGGPVDARRSPTKVNELATTRSYAWFERNMIHRVGRGHAGVGRRVYPGFLQLTAFVSMNPERHLESHWNYWRDVLRGARGAEGRAHHEQFYDEYNAVLDMDAPYYLETVKRVFQDFDLARGRFEVAGHRVEPRAIERTALFTIEGEHDDVAGRGQTEAAHGLCTGIKGGGFPSAWRRHLLVPGCGHYGVFSGHRWRESTYPLLRDFIREAGAAQKLAA
jgi:poly(3-hydroxybutyrate) depolymerase